MNAVDRSWTLRLPFVKPPLSLNSRMHPMAKAKITKRIRLAAAVLARHEHIPALPAIHVTLTYTPRDKRGRDRDNLVATLKPLIDGLVDAGIVPDDTPQYVSWEPPVITEPDRRDPRLHLTITERKAQP